MYWEVFSYWKKEYGLFKWVLLEFGWVWEIWVGVIKFGYVFVYDFVIFLDC